MGNWVHRMESVDRKALTGVCQSCGPVPILLRPRKGKEPLATCEVAYQKKLADYRVKRRKEPNDGK